MAVGCAAAGQCGTLRSSLQAVQASGARSRWRQAPGKTYTAANIAYRLINGCGCPSGSCSWSIGSNLGTQTLKEFQHFTALLTTERKSPELYDLQQLHQQHRRSLSPR